MALIEDVAHMKRRCTIDSIPLFIDSQKRDRDVSPNASELVLTLDPPLRNVCGIDVLDVAMPSTSYSIDLHNNIINIGRLEPFDAAMDATASKDLMVYLRQLLTSRTFGKTTFFKHRDVSDFDLCTLFDVIDPVTTIDELSQYLEAVPDGSWCVACIRRRLPVISLPITIIELTSSLSEPSSSSTTTTSIDTIQQQQQQQQQQQLHQGNIQVRSIDAVVHSKIDESMNDRVFVVRDARTVLGDAFMSCAERGDVLYDPDTSMLYVFQFLQEVFVEDPSWVQRAIVHMTSRKVTPGSYNVTSLRDELTYTMMHEKVTVSSTSFIDTQTGRLKFTSPQPFFFGYRGSSISTSIGFDSLKPILQEGSYVHVRVKGSSDSAILPIMKPSIDFPGRVSYEITAPGLVSLLGERYVLLRIPEIESQVLGTNASSAYAPGIALLKLAAATYDVSHLRLDYVSLVRKPFHPIGKVSRLTIRLETASGRPYNLRGNNYLLLLAIKMYTPDNSVTDALWGTSKLKSTLNASYQSDFSQYALEHIMRERDLDDDRAITLGNADRDEASDSDDYDANDGNDENDDGIGEGVGYPSTTPDTVDEDSDEYEHEYEDDA